MLFRSTYALTNTTMRYALELADKGAKGAARGSKPISLGINTLDGHVTCQPVAQGVGLEYVELGKLL